MNKMLLILPLVAAFFSCTEYRVYTDYGVNLDGVLIWQDEAEIEIVTSKERANVWVDVVNSEYNDPWNILNSTTNGLCVHTAFPIDPTKIFVLEKFIESAALVAHEMGHCIGHRHNDDPTSIMYGGGIPKDKPLSWFKEFQ